MEKLAMDGGAPAFPGWTGASRPKLGVEEFMALARRFRFTDEALERIKAAVTDDDFKGEGPYLARYYGDPSETQGTALEALAREKFGTEYAMCVCNGTGALHSAFVAVGAKPGGEVIVPAIGFMATAAAVAMTGATPVFCDVDESLHLDPTKLEARINANTVAIVPTHVMGGIADLAPILDIAKRRGIRVIEDCAQSPGGRYRGRYVGTWGDMGCFSISAYKIIGAGEGGMFVTNDRNLYERAAQLAECGGLWRPDRFAAPRYPGELFAGTNYRMSDIEATIDVIQLGKLDGVVSRFNAVKTRVLAGLSRFKEVTPQKLNDPEGEVGYLLRLFPETVELGAKLAAALRAEGVSVGFRGANPSPDWHIYWGMFPIAESCDNEISRCRKGSCPVADSLWERELQISLSQWGTPEDADRLAAAINKVFSAFCEAAD